MRSSSSLKASRFLVAGAPSGAAAQVGAVAPRSHASRERSGPPRAVTRNRSFGFFFRFVGGGASSRAWTASKDPGGGAVGLSSMACASGYSPRCGANSSSVLTMSARRVLRDLVGRGVARDRRQVVPLVDDDDRVLQHRVEAAGAADHGVDELRVRDEDERGALLDLVLRHVERADVRRLALLDGVLDVPDDHRPAEAKVRPPPSPAG